MIEQATRSWLTFESVTRCRGRFIAESPNIPDALNCRNRAFRAARRSLTDKHCLLSLDPAILTGLKTELIGTDTRGTQNSARRYHCGAVLAPNQGRPP